MLKQIKDRIDGMRLDFAQSYCGEPEENMSEEEQEDYDNMIEEYIDAIGEGCDAEGERENQLWEQGYGEGFEQCAIKYTNELNNILRDELEDSYEKLLSFEDGREVKGKGLCEEDICDADNIFQKNMTEANNKEFVCGKILILKNILDDIKY